MAYFKINERDIFFILKDQLRYGDLCKLDRYREIDENTLDMLVSETIKLARTKFDPLQEHGEKWGVIFEKGTVRCCPEFRDAYALYGQNGWISASRSAKYGGQGFPDTLRIIINDVMYGAAQSFNMAPSLSHGAGHLIESFATEELKEIFVAKMFSGQWAGTMALTEPNAGSNLAAIRTTAFREGNHFKIKGNKTFISYGDHDLTENIIHLLLARIEGSPEGIGGISLFIVPKIKVNPNGSLGEPNDVICTRVEEKLGLHASPTCSLNFGENNQCIGYLCGQENKGLAHMFQMMNAARINAGVSCMTLASTAYQNALSYAKERVQGADLASRKSGSVPIIDHPDVRRMLLWMKAMVDGMRSMVYTAALWNDYALGLSDAEKRKRYHNLVDFMTPIIKAYCSDMGFRVCETAVQVLGGYGFCSEYPMEGYLRDAKITSLYEGTNGIQSIDLMGRKMQIDNGTPFKVFMSEIGHFCQRHSAHPVLSREILLLHSAVERLGDMAAEMLNRYKSDQLQWASYTYPSLLCFGDMVLTWRLLDMACVAHRAIEEGKKDAFYVGKVMQATYFAGLTLPLAMARMETCIRNGREIIDIPDDAF